MLGQSAARLVVFMITLNEVNYLAYATKLTLCQPLAQSSQTWVSDQSHGKEGR